MTNVNFEKKIDLIYFRAVNQREIIFYDGECGFCNQSVQFVLKYDSKKRFFFAPLQGAFAKGLFEDHGLQPDMSTFYFAVGEKLFERSSAGIRVLGKLRFPLNLMMMFIIIPAPLRDIVYNAIAKRRHRIMSGYCVIPTEEQKKRFIS